MIVVKTRVLVPFWNHHQLQRHVESLLFFALVFILTLHSLNIFAQSLHFNIELLLTLLLLLEQLKENTLFGLLLTSFSARRCDASEPCILVDHGRLDTCLLGYEALAHD